MSNISVKVTMEFIVSDICDEQNLIDEGKTIDELTRWIIGSEYCACSISDSRGTVVKVERIQEE